MLLQTFPHYLECLSRACLSKAPSHRILQCTQQYVGNDWLRLVRFDTHPMTFRITPSVDIVTFGSDNVGFVNHTHTLAIVLHGSFDTGGRGTILPMKHIVARSMCSAVVLVQQEPSKTPILFR